MSGLAGTVMTGMAFGAGSEIAHQGVRAMMGSGSGHGSAPVEQAPAQGAPVQQQQQEYVDYSQLRPTHARTSTLTSFSASSRTAIKLTCASPT